MYEKFKARARNLESHWTNLDHNVMLSLLSVNFLLLNFNTILKKHQTVYVNSINKLFKDIHFRLQLQFSVNAGDEQLHDCLMYKLNGVCSY